MASDSHLHSRITLRFRSAFVRVVAHKLPRQSQACRSPFLTRSRLFRSASGPVRAARDGSMPAFQNPRPRVLELHNPARAYLRPIRTSGGLPFLHPSVGTSLAVSGDCRLPVRNILGADQVRFPCGSRARSLLGIRLCVALTRTHHCAKALTRQRAKPYFCRRGDGTNLYESTHRCPTMGS